MLETNILPKNQAKYRTLVDMKLLTQQYKIEGDYMVYEIGDIVKLKKQHPCKSYEWEVLRVGADFRLKCLGCGHQIMISRKLVEKNTKSIRKPDGQ